MRFFFFLIKIVLSIWSDTEPGYIFASSDEQINFCALFPNLRVKAVDFLLGGNRKSARLRDSTFCHLCARKNASGTKCRTVSNKPNQLRPHWRWRTTNRPRSETTYLVISHPVWQSKSAWIPVTIFHCFAFYLSNLTKIDHKLNNEERE